MPDVVSILNQNLATLIDLKLRLKQAHWNVRGLNFIGLHKLFDKAQGEVEGFYDTVAERIGALGDEARGTLEDVKDSTRLDEYMLGTANGEKHVSAIMQSLDKACGETKQAIADCLEAKDQATADAFIEITRGLDQLRYLIGSHYGS